MNLKLLIVFLMLPFCGKAQIILDSAVAGPWHKSPYYAYNGTLRVTTSNQFDTVRCIILVCDTLYTKRVYWINGYEVRVCEFIYCDPSEKLLAKTYWSCDHVEYLDENKKPLSKNIIVWMSKNTEQ